MIARTVALTRAYAAQHRVELTVAIAADLPLVNGDAELLHQALVNLLLNGMHATSPGGTISVQAEATGAGSGAPLIEVDLAMYRDTAQGTALFGTEGSGGAWAEAGSGSLLLRGLADAPAVHAPLAERLQAQSIHAGPRLLIVTTDTTPLPEAIIAHIPLHVRVPPLRERSGDYLAAGASRGWPAADQ